MKQLGTRNLGETLTTKINTNDGTVPITIASSAVVVYREGSLTQSTTAATLTVAYDGVVGLHDLSIDTSDLTFFAANADYTVSLSAGTVDGNSVVGTVLAEFRLETPVVPLDPSHGPIYGPAWVATSGTVIKTNANQVHLQPQILFAEDFPAGSFPAAVCAVCVWSNYHAADNGAIFMEVCLGDLSTDPEAWLKPANWKTLAAAIAAGDIAWANGASDSKVFGYTVEGNSTETPAVVLVDGEAWMYIHNDAVGGVGEENQRTMVAKMDAGTDPTAWTMQTTTRTMYSGQPTNTAVITPMIEGDIALTPGGHTGYFRPNLDLVLPGPPCLGYAQSTYGGGDNPGSAVWRIIDPQTVELHAYGRTAPADVLAGPARINR